MNPPPAPALPWMPRRQTAADSDTPAPRGLVAQGGVARAVLARLQALDAAQLQPLSATACRDFLVLLGPASSLPWVDGVRYCAPATTAPGLWLPTHVQPDLPADLLQAALARRVQRAPVLLWHDPEQIFPLNEAANLTTDYLQWLSRVL